MTQTELLDGICWLANRLYHPQAFGERLLHFIKRYQAPPLAHLSRRALRPVELNLIKVVQHLYSLGEGEAKMISEVTSAAAEKPAIYGLVGVTLFQYAQIRHMYQQQHFWEPHLAEQPRPMSRAAVARTIHLV